MRVHKEIAQAPSEEEWAYMPHMWEVSCNVHVQRGKKITIPTSPDLPSGNRTTRSLGEAQRGRSQRELNALWQESVQRRCPGGESRITLRRAESRLSRRVMRAATYVYQRILR